MAKGYWDIQLEVQVSGSDQVSVLGMINDDGDPCQYEQLVDSLVQELIANKEYLKEQIINQLAIGHFVYTDNQAGPGKEKSWIYNRLEDPKWRRYSGCTCALCLKFD